MRMPLVIGVLVTGISIGLNLGLFASAWMDHRPSRSYTFTTAGIVLLLAAWLGVLFTI